MFLRGRERLAAGTPRIGEWKSTRQGHGGGMPHRDTPASRHWPTSAKNAFAHFPHDHDMTREARPLIPVTR